MSREDLQQWSWWKKKLLKHFLPLGFAAALFIGLVWPLPGDELSSWKAGNFRIFQTINVATIFAVSGFTLKTDEALRALKQPKALVYGLVSILAITPMLAFALLEIPFEQREFATGLAIFSTMPTTLSSGVALVNLAYGNGALALLLTIVSNLVGIATVPFLLKEIISTLGSIDLDSVRLLVNLIISIFIPLAVGKGVQGAVPGAHAFAAQHKTLLSLVSNVSLVLIVWQTISRNQGEIVGTPFAQIVLIALAGTALHVVYLALNYAASTFLLHLPEKDHKAVLFMASQKALPVAVTIISFFPPSAGSQGLLTVPCIAGHIAQLFVDAFIGGRMATAEEARLADAAAKERSVAGAESPDVVSKPESEASSVYILPIRSSAEAQRAPKQAAASTAADAQAVAAEMSSTSLEARATAEGQAAAAKALAAESEARDT